MHQPLRQNFEEMQRWAVPHPPGTWLNFSVTTRVECPDDRTVVFRFPEPGGLAIAKLRGFHIASPGFWGGPTRRAPATRSSVLGTATGGVIDAPNPWGTGPFTLSEGSSAC